MPLDLEPAPAAAGAGDAGAGVQHPLKPMEEPLAIAVLASAAGATEIEDTEPPAHYCVELGPDASSPGAHTRESAPDSTTWPARVRAALWRYRSMLLLAVAVVALLAGGSYACVAFRSQLLAAGDYIRRHAPLSAVYYALIVAVWIVLCLPSTIIELAAGLLYPYPLAIICLTAGKQLGCGIAFLIGRCVTSPELRFACCLPRNSRHATGVTGGSSSSKRSRTIQAMFLALEHHPWQITFLIRLLPIPISIKNYGMSCLPKLSFYVFMMCTLLAGIPFTVAWVYLGESCRSLLEALQGKGDDLKRHGAYVQELAFLITGLVVAVVLVALLRRYTRRYTRLLAEREALAADAAAKAAAQASEGEEQPEFVLRSLGPRDVSTASTSTTLLTLTPPTARRRSLTDNEVEEGDYDERLEGGDCFDSDGGGWETERRRQRGRRRRRSSGSTSSGLTVDVSSSFMVEEGEGCGSLEM